MSMTVWCWCCKMDNFWLRLHYISSHDVARSEVRFTDYPYPSWFDMVFSTCKKAPIVYLDGMVVFIPHELWISLFHLIISTKGQLLEMTNFQAVTWLSNLFNMPADLSVSIAGRQLWVERHTVPIHQIFMIGQYSGDGSVWWNFSILMDHYNWLRNR